MLDLPERDGHAVARRRGEEGIAVHLPKAHKLRPLEARGRLRLALGREPDESAADFDVDPAFRAGSPVETEQEALAKAMRQRPDLLAQRQAVTRVRADLKLQPANARMDYTVGSEVTRQLAFGISGSSVGFSFSMPLPVFQRNQGEIARRRGNSTGPRSGWLALNSPSGLRSD